MKSILKKLCLVLLIVSLGSCKQNKDSEATVEAESMENDVKNTAPDAEIKKAQGYVMPGLDHGLSQSPININSQATAEGGKHQITLNFKDEINKIDNLGHTIQLDFTEGSTITADNETFDFKQCHFHTPSEHLIDGLTYPMEMHIVNVMPNLDKDATPQYLVISALFKEGKENKFIAEFLNKIPKEEKTSTDVKVGNVKLSDLFGTASSDMLGQYYFYKGSLTTPPFTESVRWYIAKHVYEASAAQIEAINALEGNNARHVQAMYGRTIESD